MIWGFTKGRDYDQPPDDRSLSWEILSSLYACVCDKKNKAEIPRMPSRVVWILWSCLRLRLHGWVLNWLGTNPSVNIELLLRDPIILRVGLRVIVRIPKNLVLSSFVLAFPDWLTPADWWCLEPEMLTIPGLQEAEAERLNFRFLALRTVRGLVLWRKKKFISVLGTTEEI